MSGVFTSAGLLFLKYGSGELQPWANYAPEKKKDIYVEYNDASKSSQIICKWTKYYISFSFEYFIIEIRDDISTRSSRTHHKYLLHPFYVGTRFWLKDSPSQRTDHEFVISDSRISWKPHPYLEKSVTMTKFSKSGGGGIEIFSIWSYGGVLRFFQFFRKKSINCRRGGGGGDIEFFFHSFVEKSGNLHTGRYWDFSIGLFGSHWESEFHSEVVKHREDNLL